MRNMKNTSTRELIQDACENLKGVRSLPIRDAGASVAVDRLAEVVEILIELIERKNK